MCGLQKQEIVSGRQDMQYIQLNLSNLIPQVTDISLNWTAFSQLNSKKWVGYRCGIKVNIVLLYLSELQTILSNRHPS